MGHNDLRAMMEMEGKQKTWAANVNAEALQHWRGHMREISVKHYRAKYTDKISEIVQGLPEVPQ